MNITLKCFCLVAVFLLTACFEGQQTIKIRSASDSEVLVDMTIDKDAYQSMNEMGAFATMFDNKNAVKHQAQISWIKDIEQKISNIEGVSQLKMIEEDSSDGKSKHIQAQWHTNSLSALTDSLKYLPAKEKLLIKEDNGLIKVSLGMSNDKAMFRQMSKDKIYILRLEGNTIESNQKINLWGVTELKIPLDSEGPFLLSATIDPHAVSKTWIWLIIGTVSIVSVVVFMVLRQRYNAKKLVIVIVLIGSTMIVSAFLFTSIQKGVSIQSVQTAQSKTKAAITPLVGEGEDLTTLNNRVQTSQGILSLIRVDKEEFERPDLYLGQKMLLAAEGRFINLERRFQLHNGELIVGSLDEGGTGTFPSYFMILLQQGSPSQLLGHEEFYSQTNTIKYQQKEDVITIDLGLQNGLKKTITFEKGQLLVGGVQVLRTQLAEQDCQWLHTDVLLMCADSQSMGNECDQNAIFEPSMVETRGLNDLRQNPNFNEKAMIDACYQSCLQQNRPDYDSFKLRVCGG